MVRVLAIGALVLAMMAGPVGAETKSECNILEDGTVQHRVCDCSYITNDIERLECFDRIARIANLVRWQARARLEQVRQIEGGEQLIIEFANELSNSE